jgi:hypothetical protein
MRNHRFNPKLETHTKIFKDIVTGNHSSSRRAKRRRELMRDATPSGIPGR